ncbi:MAG: sirohydrochlorin cobaltochelatase [Sarcina sp.]
MKTVVILVHFGTANKEAIENSIFKLENEVKMSEENYEVISSFMLKRISTILKNKESIDIEYFEDVLARVNTKFERIIVQPVYLIDGEEYKKIERIVDGFKNESLAKIELRKPLIYSEKIEQELLCERLVESLKEEIIKLEEDKNDEINLFIGHGSDNLENNQYQVLEKSFKKISKNIIIGTLMGAHDKEYIRDFLIKNNIRKVRVYLLFMLIGKHVRLDVLGNVNSWISMLNDENIEVEVIDKSLLEYGKIRRIFIDEIL